MNIAKSKTSLYVKISRSTYNELKQAAYRWYALEESKLAKLPDGYTSLSKYADDIMSGKVKK